MARSYLNYSGQTSQPFTVLSAFIKNGNNYQFAFDTWRSTTDFNNEADPFAPLSRNVNADASFATTNATLLQQLGTAMLIEMGFGGRNFTLTNVQWLPVSQVLIMIAEKDKSGSTMVKQGADAVAFYTANKTAFDNLNAAIWTYAKANDGFFLRMTPAT